MPGSTEITFQKTKRTFGRAVLWLFAVLVGLIAIVAVIGLALPKSHLATSKLKLNAPPDAVWQALLDHNADAQWRKNVQSVEHLPDANGHQVWREHYTNGEALTFEDTLTCGSERKLVRTIADKDLPFGGSWVYRVDPAENGSNLVIAEAGEVRNPIFRFVSRFVMGHYATINEYQGYLAAKFNESPRFENAAERATWLPELLTECQPRFRYLIQTPTK